MKQQIKLSGLDCASCALAIEHALDQVPGVRDAEVNEKASTLHVDFDEAAVSNDAILTAVRDAGFDAELVPGS